MGQRVLLLWAILIGSFLTGCALGPAGTPVPRTGPWRMVLDLNGRSLPFQFDLSRSDSGGWLAHIHNASEDILVTDIVLLGDSFRMRMPLFDSEFRGSLQSDSLITGAWHNLLKGSDYRIPFSARAGAQPRFGGTGHSNNTVQGKWEVSFSKDTPDSYKAIGMFEESPDGAVTGTFVTETGDYRFLEGLVTKDSLSLSCFDGSHAFLFAASLHGDSLVGRYWSGTHWEEPWVAYRNPGFQLRNPDSLTFLKEGYHMVDFSLPDLDGRSVSPSDERYVGKVLMIQVMGSWCPNCVDETIVLRDLYRTYHSQGLEVIAVAFEKYPDEARALAGLKRFRSALGVEYPITFGGSAAKENAAAKLPFLNHVMSYPTCIFVDRNGVVRRIRTGFYGPSTGEHHLNYRRNLRRFVEELLAERSDGHKP